MEHRLELKLFTGDEGEIATKWLNENVGEKDVAWKPNISLFGVVYLFFKEEEDKVKFILKYGEYIV